MYLRVSKLAPVPRLLLVLPGMELVLLLPPPALLLVPEPVVQLGLLLRHPHDPLNLQGPQGQAGRAVDGIVVLLALAHDLVVFLHGGEGRHATPAEGHLESGLVEADAADPLLREVALLLGRGGRRRGHSWRQLQEARPDDPHGQDDGQGVEDTGKEERGQDAQLEDVGEVGQGGGGRQGAVEGGGQAGGQGGGHGGGGGGEGGVTVPPAPLVLHVHREGIDQVSQNDDGGGGDRVDYVEVCDEGDVEGGVGRVEGGGEDGGEGGEAGDEEGQVEDLEGDDEVEKEEDGEDQIPGGDGEKGAHKAKADGSEGDVEEEEGRGAEVGGGHMVFLWRLPGG